MWVSGLCTIEQAEFCSLYLETCCILPVFSTKSCSCLHDLMFCCHWALLPGTCSRLQNRSWSWDARDLTAFCCRKSDPIWCYVTMLWLCSHVIPQRVLIDFRSIMWSWHLTWPTWPHASTPSKMRCLTLLHHKEIMCLCIYINCISGFSSLPRYCGECDRRLLRNWNNSGDKRSSPAKARKRRFSWMKAAMKLKCLSFS